MSKVGGEESSLSEKPGCHRPRRLAEWLNPTGERKVHSLVDKIYKRKNLEVAWEKVKRNGGVGGIDGVDIATFEAELEEQLDRMHGELRDGTYEPQPVEQHLIPKAGQPEKHRALGIPTIYDRVCQQAMLNRLEPIFEAVFDEASFGYRKGRSTKDALRKVWRELEQGSEWVVDADLRDFFGSVDHHKTVGAGQSAGIGRSGSGSARADPPVRLCGRRQAAGNGAEFVNTNYFHAMDWLKHEKEDVYDPSYTDMLRVAFTRSSSAAAWRTWSLYFPAAIFDRLRKSLRRSPFAGLREQFCAI